MYQHNVSAKAKLLFLLMALLMLSFPARAQTAEAQIDNCCFVDRQCETNDEWVSGYYAYQNNQCGAPQQQQQQQLSQSQAASSEINNCCFTGWQCDSQQEWNSGYYAFQSDQCASQSNWEEQWQGQQNGDQQRQAQFIIQELQTSYSRQSPSESVRAQARRPEAKKWWCDEPPEVCWSKQTPWERRAQVRETISIVIDLSNPNRRQDVADDGSLVIIDPELPD